MGILKMGQSGGCCWISVEGTDATGKTLLCKELYKKLLSLYPEKKFELLEEFSDSVVGDVVRSVILRKTFFSLGDNLRHALSETLVLFADLAFQLEEVRDRVLKNCCVISDRGPHSLLVYQWLRLSDQYGGDDDFWDDWIRRISEPIGHPDYSICLVSGMEDIRQRLVKRGDVMSEENLRFIQRVQDRYIRVFHDQEESAVILENREGKFDEVVDRALGAVEPLLT